MTARVPRLEQAEDAAAVHEVKLSQVEDDRLPLNHDLVDLALEVLDARHIQALLEGAKSRLSALKVVGPPASFSSRLSPDLRQ